jgi:aryl-alcohol dehydrogenase-like predicted oxidoreductase
MSYRFTGRSGLQLPALSLRLWQHFGTDRPEETQRAILRRAFDRGVTHIDPANNYGPPYGRAEENVGRYLRDDFLPYRDERVTSAVIGASSVEQLDTNLDALSGPPLADDELAEIDRCATESEVNLWAKE